MSTIVAVALPSVPVAPAALPEGGEGEGGGEGGHVPRSVHPAQLECVASKAALPAHAQRMASLLALPPGFSSKAVPCRVGGEACSMGKGGGREARQFRSGKPS